MSGDNWASFLFVVFALVVGCTYAITSEIDRRSGDFVRIAQ